MSKNNTSHLLVVGDFNYPSIVWSTWTTAGDNTESEVYKFIETLRDGYVHVYQHVTQTTRGRDAILLIYWTW